MLLTGSESMIGRFIQKDYEIIKSPKTDLTDYKSTLDLFKRTKPKFVIHLAGYNFGLLGSQKYMSDIYSRTSRIGLNVLEAAHLNNVEKVVSVLSSCSYSKSFEEELKETDFLEGACNESIECHGYAKRILFHFSKQLFKQYKRNYVCCVLNNCFGEYDRFDPERSKVIGALIKKFVEARDNKLTEVECHGSGTPLRSFLYAKDAAHGILQVLAKYNNPLEVINIDGNNEISILELAEKIAKYSKFQGNIKWNLKTDGALRKKLSTVKMKNILNWEPETNFDEALKITIEWFDKNKNNWTK